MTGARGSNQYQRSGAPAREMFHGTARANLARIIEEGLVNPYLTDEAEIAEYYAAQEADDKDSEPVILTVTVTDDMLRYDGAAMDEPVMVPDSDRDQAWDDAAAAHPEWLHGDTIVVPPEAFGVSLQGARSVRVESVLTDWSEDT